MAQAAERVLQGQLPHRDFNEGYTGGLTWLHAAAFRLLGVSIWSLRATLFAFAIASIPIWYYVARRFVPPLVAAIATLTCLAWSVPNYPAPLPSWYNLFFAMAAVAALLRYIEKRRLRWVFLAGLAAGLSILAKITGVYLVAAVAVFLTFEAAFDDGWAPKATRGQSSVAAVLLLPMVVLAVSPLQLTLSAHDPNSLNSLLTLGLPAALVAGTTSVVIVRRWRCGWRPNVRVLRGLLVLSAGVAVVLLVFSIPISRGARHWSALSRCSSPGAIAPPRPKRDGSRARPCVAGFLSTNRLRVHPRTPRQRDSATVGFGPSNLLDSGRRRCIQSASGAVPLALRSHAHAAAHTARRAAHVESVKAYGGAVGPIEATRSVVSGAAWCSLIQFPFTYPTYFAYVAPLVIVAAIALAEVNGRLSPTLRGITLAGYCAFAFIMRPRIYPERSVEPGPLSTLTPPRAGGYSSRPATRATIKSSSPC